MDIMFCSTPIFSRCIPDNVPEFVANLVDFIKNLDTISMVLSDIYLCRYAIVGLCFLALRKCIFAVIVISTPYSTIFFRPKGTLKILKLSKKLKVHLRYESGVPSLHGLI